MRRGWGLVMLTLWLAAASAGELRWQGQWTQGGLIIGQASPGTRMALNGQPVFVGPDGAFVFGFSRDAPPQARLTLLFPDGSREERVLMIAQRQYLDKLAIRGRCMRSRLIRPAARYDRMM